MPKPPPTSGQITRIFSIGIFSNMLAEDLAQAVAALAADRERQMIALGVVFGDYRTRLHEIGDDAAD